MFTRHQHRATDELVFFAHSVLFQSSSVAGMSRDQPALHGCHRPGLHLSLSGTHVGGLSRSCSTNQASGSILVKPHHRPGGGRFSGGADQGVGMPSQQLAPVVLLGSLPPVGPESFLPIHPPHPPLHLSVIFSSANLCGRAPLHLAG